MIEFYALRACYRRADELEQLLAYWPADAGRLGSVAHWYVR